MVCTGTTSAFYFVCACVYIDISPSTRPVFFKVAAHKADSPEKWELVVFPSSLSRTHHFLLCSGNKACCRAVLSYSVFQRSFVISCSVNFIQSFYYFPYVQSFFSLNVPVGVALSSGLHAINTQSSVSIIPCAVFNVCDSRFSTCSTQTFQKMNVLWRNGSHFSSGLVTILMKRTTTLLTIGEATN